MYDIIVIGAGSGGLNIAGFMNKAGFKTLLIDKSDQTIGGDCLNFGCVPSKALIHLSRLARNAKEAERFGMKTSGKINLKTVMQYVKEKQDVIRKHENAAWFRKIGMDVALGNAKFVGRDAVEVAGKRYEGKKIVIATGSRPRELRIPGVEHVDYQTNETIFGLERLPDRLLVIGGGPIGVELGQAFLRLGSSVTLLERGSKFLPKESPEIADVLYQQLTKEGMDIRFNTEIKEFTSSRECTLVHRGTKEEKIKFDEVLVNLVSIGRQLNTEGLDLGAAGIEMNGAKIKVDRYLRTTNKNVYLCGDIVGSYQFTHAAELHAAVIINNFFSPLKKKLNNDHLSWVTYTSPEIATFGINEAEIQRRGISYETLSLGFEDDDRAIVDELTYGKLVLFIDKNGKLLGGSMVAEHAGELFQELLLAHSSGLGIKALFNKIYPYPTASRVNKKIVSNHFSKKLTPRAKKLLKVFYR